jgi:hypothetical protein
MRDVMVRLALLAEQSGDKVSDARLDFTAEKIIGYGATEVCEALELLLENSRRFPTIEEIKKALGVSEIDGRDLGTHSANLLIAAMGKFGALNGAKQSLAVKLALGESLWHIVESMGGWNLCIDRAGENLSAFVAQTRDLVASYSASGVIDAKKIPTKLMHREDAFELAGKNLSDDDTPQIGSGGNSFLAIAGQILNSKKAEI